MQEEEQDEEEDDDKDKELDEDDGIAESLERLFIAKSRTRKRTSTYAMTPNTNRSHRTQNPCTPKAPYTHMM